MIRPILFGHRGASIELPENTLEAFELAVELGADALETDVHVTADGAVVIHHDASALRMAADRRLVRSLRLEEVSRLNVGFGFRAKDGTGLPDRSFRAPLLAEALERFPNQRFNIDIKPEHGAVSLVMDVVKKYGAEQRVLLTSFYDSVVREVRRNGYRGETGLAQKEAIRALLLPASAPRWLAPSGQRIQLPVRVGPVDLVTKSLIDRLHQQGLKVDFWVINDVATARKAEAAGADGIMTDDVRLIAGALGR